MGNIIVICKLSHKPRSAFCKTAMREQVFDSMYFVLYILPSERHK